MYVWFCWYCPAVSQSGCYNLYSHQPWVRVPVAPRPHQYFVLSVLLISASLVGRQSSFEMKIILTFFFSSLHGSRHPPRRSVEHTHRQNEDNKKSSQLLLPFGTFLPIHLSICMWQNSIIPQELFSETWSWSCLHIYEYLSIASFLEAK